MLNDLCEFLFGDVERELQNFCNQGEQDCKVFNLLRLQYYNDLQRLFDNKWNLFYDHLLNEFSYSTNVVESIATWKEGIKLAFQAFQLPIL